MGFYSKRHYQSVSPPADTQDQIRERLIARRAGELGHDDMLARYRELTTDNALQALEYQKERIAHHTRALTASGYAGCPAEVKKILLANKKG